MTSTLMPMAVDVGRPGMAVRVRHVDDRTVVWLEGEHDVVTAAVLADIMATAIADDESDIVVDLSECTFVSLATIDVILSAREFLKPRSRHLVIRSPSRTTTRILVLLELGSMVEPAAA